MWNQLKLSKKKVCNMWHVPFMHDFSTALIANSKCADPVYSMKCFAYVLPLAMKRQNVQYAGFFEKVPSF